MKVNERGLTHDAGSVSRGRLLGLEPPQFDGEAALMAPAVVHLEWVGTNVLQRAYARSMGMRVAGLFAGIGGISSGCMRRAWKQSFSAKKMPRPRRFLLEHFDEVPLVGDVNELVALPATDVVAGGFPCQDLSQAGRTAGINGSESGLVKEVFRLLSRSSATWLLLENVPFMLQLDRGGAMRFLRRVTGANGLLVGIPSR